MWTKLFTNKAAAVESIATQGIWFGFSLQANPVFYPSEVGEPVPDLSEKDEALTWLFITWPL